MAGLLRGSRRAGWQTDTRRGNRGARLVLNVQTDNGKTTDKPGCGVMLSNFKRRREGQFRVSGAAAKEKGSDCAGERSRTTRFSVLVKWWWDVSQQ